MDKEKTYLSIDYLRYATCHNIIKHLELPEERLEYTFKYLENLEPEYLPHYVSAFYEVYEDNYPCLLDRFKTLLAFL